MSHSSRQDPSSFKEEGPKHNHLAGVALFETAFDFYAWYLSYDLTPAKHHMVFELLSLLMQVAKLSFEGAAILSAQEEKHLLKELSDLSDSLANGLVKNYGLVDRLEKMVCKLTDSNPKSRLVAALVRLEYKICYHGDKSCDEAFQMVCKGLIQQTFEKISSSLPDLIASTLSRELEALIAKPLDETTFLDEFQSSLTLLKHVY